MWLPCNEFEGNNGFDLFKRGLSVRAVNKIFQFSGAIDRLIAGFFDAWYHKPAIRITICDA